MAESFWAAAGPSKPTAASLAAVPGAAVTKKKRGRVSDGTKASIADSSGSIPSIIHPSSPELVPRHTSSASSWGIEDFSDSDSDFDLPTSSAPVKTTAVGTAFSNAPSLASLDHDQDELTRFARPAKRIHLETPEDRHTYGKLAGLQIDPTSLAGSMPGRNSFERPHGVRSNSGVTGAFGLKSNLASGLGFNAEPAISAPRVPPSSPTKTPAASYSLPSSASTIYQQAVAPAPPASPTTTNRGFASSSPPLQTQSSIMSAAPMKRASSADLEDSDMQLRRGTPKSYEVERDRIVVTSLEDTSSSEGSGSSDANGQKTPDADTSTETKESSSGLVINNELMEKLEAHSRAVLTGTSDRDSAANSPRPGAAGNSSRSRRSGRRSASGSAVPGLGSLLSSRRRSGQSSPASSGYASPINAEDARGALILWKDPEEVLKATSTLSASPLKQSEVAPGRESDTSRSDFMTQPPVSFQSASSQPMFSNNNPLGATSVTHKMPGLAGLPSPSHAVESPLYAQQSSLSSSYFPEPSPLETRFANTAAQPTAVSFGSAGFNNGLTSRSHYPGSGLGYHEAPLRPAAHGSMGPPPFGAAQVNFYQQQSQPHYGHHYGPPSNGASSSFQSFGAPSQQHLEPINHRGAQPIDLSGHCGPAEEMDLDS